MKSTRKTLKKEAFEHAESKDLYSRERSKAKSSILFGKLKLRFLTWLESSGAHNTHDEWETDTYETVKGDWEYVAWSEAISRFIEDLQSDDFYVDIVANTNNYTIRVGLWDKNDKKFKKTKDDMIDEFKKIPLETRKEMDQLFRGFFNLHEKDSNDDHPKYSDYRKLVDKFYKKGMKTDVLKVILIKGNKSTDNKSPLLDLLRE